MDEKCPDKIVKKAAKCKEDFEIEVTPEGIKTALFWWRPIAEQPARRG
jgi:hypothetical protein